MARGRYHDRSRTKGVNLPLYWTLRAALQPGFAIYFRISRRGRRHIPAAGPAILVSNHRSFLDPFAIATMTRRPLHYVAKRELFESRWRAWLLNALGAFPVDRGQSDQDAVDTARAILARGGVVLVFAEGTRVRPGPLGAARRGFARLALETGAPVVPIAVHGTDAVRSGLVVRPHKISVRAGAPLVFSKVADPSPELAAAVVGRVWPCVELQWLSLGGEAPAGHSEPGSVDTRQRDRAKAA